MKLRVWHIPQVPGKSFYVYTDDIREAKKIMDIMAAYDQFQLENKIKPDFANVSGVQMWDETEQEWIGWNIETEDEYFDDVDEYLSKDEELNKFSNELFGQLKGDGTKIVESIKQIIQDMEHGVYDFTKDGKCSQCRACCSDLLPISESEYHRIKQYIKKHNIKEQKHTSPESLVEQHKLDLTCPFLNDNEKTEKCAIYPVRPAICRCFVCDDPQGARNHPELYDEERIPVSMRETFFREVRNEDN